MKKHPDIVCVGADTVDIIAQTVDQWPEKGTIHLIDDLEQHTGGCAMSTAAVLGELGTDVGVVAVLGDDPAGKFILEQMKTHGIRTSGIRIKSGISSPYTYACVHPGGERSFFYYPGSANELKVEDVEMDSVGRIIHIGGGLLFPGLDGKGLADLLKRMQKRGILTTYDPALCEYTIKHENLLGPCYEHLSVFMPSLDEARIISGLKNPEDMARYFLDRGVGRVVIKLGGEGSYSLDADSEHRYPAFNVAVVDTTGAGDSFVGGYLFGLLNGFSAEDCLIWGNAAGARCVQKSGATSNLMNEEQMREWIEQQLTSL